MVSPALLSQSEKKDFLLKIMYKLIVAHLSLVQAIPLIEVGI